MSPRLWTERIEDILEAIAEIQEFTRSMSFEQFRDDPKTLKAVALDIVVIANGGCRGARTIGGPRQSQTRA